MELTAEPQPVVEYITEKRLIGTLITRKPSRVAAAAAVSILLFIVGVTFMYWSNQYGMGSLMSVSGKSLFVDGEWWRAFTATLVHGDFGHLLSNSYMLLVFSYFVISYFGLWTYPVSAFLLSGLVNVLTVMTYPAEVNLLGASGMVYFLGGFWLTSYFLIQRQYSWQPRLLRVLGIALLVFFPTTFVPTTSYTAHAIGFALGAVFAGVYFVKNRKQIQGFEEYKYSVIKDEVA